MKENMEYGMHFWYSSPWGGDGYRLYIHNQSLTRVSGPRFVPLVPPPSLCSDGRVPGVYEQSETQNPHGARPNDVSHPAGLEFTHMQRW